MLWIVTRQEWPTVLSELETFMKPCQVVPSTAWQPWQLFALHASLPRESRCFRPVRNFCDAEPSTDKRGPRHGADECPDAATQSGAVAVAWSSSRWSMLCTSAEGLRSPWYVQVRQQSFWGANTKIPGDGSENLTEMRGYTGWRTEQVFLSQNRTFRNVKQTSQRDSSLLPSSVNKR
jgi:hypothetical protein